jgi:hypothetical protein
MDPRQISMIVEFVYMFHKKAIILDSQVKNPKTSLFFRLTNKIPSCQRRVLLL